MTEEVQMRPVLKTKKGKKTDTTILVNKVLVKEVREKYPSINLYATFNKFLKELLKERRDEK